MFGCRLLETMFPVWETGKHWENLREPYINVSGKMLSRFVDGLLKLTGLSSGKAAFTRQTKVGKLVLANSS